MLIEHSVPSTCTLAEVAAAVVKHVSQDSEPSVSDLIEIAEALTPLGRRNLAHALASTDALASMQIASDMAQAAGAHSLDRYRDPRDVAWIEQLQQENAQLLKRVEEVAEERTARFVAELADNVDYAQGTDGSSVLVRRT